MPFDPPFGQPAPLPGWPDAPNDTPLFWLSARPCLRLEHSVPAHPQCSGTRHPAVLGGASWNVRLGAADLFAELDARQPAAELAAGILARRQPAGPSLLRPVERLGAAWIIAAKRGRPGTARHCRQHSCAACADRQPNPAVYGKRLDQRSSRASLLFRGPGITSVADLLASIPRFRPKLDVDESSRARCVEQPIGCPARRPADSRLRVVRPVYSTVVGLRPWRSRSRSKQSRSIGGKPGNYGLAAVENRDAIPSASAAIRKLPRSSARRRASRGAGSGRLFHQATPAPAAISIRSRQDSGGRLQSIRPGRDR